LASAFGLLAAVLAAIGVYGVLAYSTAQRTREFGVRIAVGATPGNIVRIVFSDLLWLILFGVVIGVPLALLCAQALRSQLFGVSKSDPLTLLLAAIGVALVALLGAVIPARRASRVDPIVALRHE
jgi:putative ABC transport system permease protein